MGAEDRMMRRPARHHNICVCLDCQRPGRQVSRQRADDNRHASREIRHQLDPHECPMCGWFDIHPYSLVGWTCVWCRHVWDD